LRAELIAWSNGAQFATEGDGEVIVAGLPPLGPARCAAARMFAFLIWDAERGCCSRA